MTVVVLFADRYLFFIKTNENKQTDESTKQLRNGHHVTCYAIFKKKITS